MAAQPEQKVTVGKLIDLFTDTESWLLDPGRLVWTIRVDDLPIRWRLRWGWKRPFKLAADVVRFVFVRGS